MWCSVGFGVSVVVMFAFVTACACIVYAILGINGCVVDFVVLFTCMFAEVMDLYLVLQ